MTRLLRISEAVRRTGLSERTLRRLIAGYRLRVVRPEGLRVVLIPEDELGVLIAGRAARSTAPVASETDEDRAAGAPAR